MHKDKKGEHFGINYDAPFKLQLEEFLPKILAKLITSNKGHICYHIKRAVDKQIKREGK